MKKIKLICVLMLMLGMALMLVACQPFNFNFNFDFGDGDKETIEGLNFYLLEDDTYAVNTVDNILSEVTIPSEFRGVIISRRCQCLHLFCR